MSVADRLEHVARALPHAYPGPGGAVAVVQNGAVLLRHAWGWANAERRIPFTPRSLVRMCSVTKQFTCAAVLDAVGDPAVLDGAVQARLPLLTVPAPGALDLCHNQSGLRDYWAVAMLLGSPAEAPFGDREAAAVIGATRTLQFAPGTRSSYCNQNFRILSDTLQERERVEFATVLRRRVFERAGMESAFLAADTRAMPDGTEGYEGTQAAGFRPAVNRIVWTGDAGLGASLDDMIAWEQHIDATREDEQSLYRRISAAVQFRDGMPASYGFGLGRQLMFGCSGTGHGGALRGWRTHRAHLAEARLSVVVLFNHMADAQQAALDLLGAAMDEPPVADGEPEADPDWLGAYLEPESGLLVRTGAAGPGRVRLRFGQNPELLTTQADGSARRGGTRLQAEAGGLRLERRDERLCSLLLPCGPASAADFSGRYRCDELAAELQVEASGGALYGAFSGMLGTGRMELFEHGGGDAWTLPCPRALDHTPPGDWTLWVQRDEAGRPQSIQVGCWLARGLRYERIGS